MKVLVEKKDGICTVIINRPESRNAVDRETAAQLVEAFEYFEQESTLLAAVLYGQGGNFCAGADLKAMSRGDLNAINSLDSDMSKPGPMGPSRMRTSKPVIAAVSGYAVAGGLPSMPDRRVKPPPLPAASKELKPGKTVTSASY